MISATDRSIVTTSPRDQSQALIKFAVDHLELNLLFNHIPFLKNLGFVAEKKEPLDDGFLNISGHWDFTGQWSDYLPQLDFLIDRKGFIGPRDEDSDIALSLSLAIERLLGKYLTRKYYKLIYLKKDKFAFHVKARRSPL